MIEHFDPPRLEALEAERVRLGAAGRVVVTTPNAEYNRLWETLPAGECRHPDHRFEWTRAEFAAWAAGVAARLRLRARASCRSGRRTPRRGPPTQMAVFER